MLAETARHKTKSLRSMKCWDAWMISLVITTHLHLTTTVAVTSALAVQEEKLASGLSLNWWKPKTEALMA